MRTQALARGLSTGAANKLAVKAGAGMITGSAMEGGVSGGLAGEQTRRQIETMEQETIEQHPFYKKLIEKGFSSEVIRQALADTASEEALVETGLLTGVLGLAGNRYLGKLFAGGGTGRLSSATKGVVAEGLTEAGQSASEQALSNLALKSYGDEDRSNFKGVINAAVSGGILGGILGGTLGGVVGDEKQSKLQAKPLLLLEPPVKPPVEPTIEPTVKPTIEPTVKPTVVFSKSTQRRIDRQQRSVAKRSSVAFSPSRICCHHFFFKFNLSIFIFHPHIFIFSLFNIQLNVFINYKSKTIVFFLGYIPDSTAIFFVINT